MDWQLYESKYIMLRLQMIKSFSPSTMICLDEIRNSYTFMDKIYFGLLNYLLNIRETTKTFSVEICWMVRSTYLLLVKLSQIIILLNDKRYFLRCDIINGKLDLVELIIYMAI